MRGKGEGRERKERWVGAEKRGREEGKNGDKGREVMSPLLQILDPPLVGFV